MTNQRTKSLKMHVSRNSLVERKSYNMKRNTAVHTSTTHSRILSYQERVFDHPLDDFYACFNRRNLLECTLAFPRCIIVVWNLFLFMVAVGLFKNILPVFHLSYGFATSRCLRMSPCKSSNNG
ncbi:hypothetical protein PsorP6_005422 [Peronosclerospora sorghi]|uniref:Uncharacterized protein n=1 Tax=Peronosclerospora sorghi TaxID=230839 RepID=A0ACC0W4F1_9STRA|nr:hypothetical protein PsorP6_005422 [Peronosclerospora sorghi]